MNCPRCNNQAIKFNEWFFNIKALKVTCISCGVSLVASPLIYVVITIVALFSVGIGGYYNNIWEALAFEIPTTRLRVIWFVPVMFSGVFITWKFGKYKVA
jgi:hypothetical protein